MRMLTTTLVALVAAGPSGTAAGDLQPTICWGKKGSANPRMSVWNGTTWPSATNLPSVGTEPEWVVLKACPVRDELTIATLDKDKDVNVCIWNGTSWGSVTQVCSDSGQDDARSVDVAYTASGTAMVAYWTQGSKRIGYRTHSGGSWSAEQTRTLPSDVKLRFLMLCPHPSSEEIVLLAINDDKELYATTWSGSAFGSVTTIETDMNSDKQEDAAMAFETASGHGVLVYAQKDVATPRYRTYIDGAWSSELSAPSVDDEVRWIRLAADPASDRIVMGTLDKEKDLNACIWSGTAWGSVVELENDTENSDRRGFDVAFPSSGSCLIAYAQKNEQRFQYRSLTGSTWSSEQQGPNLGSKIHVIQLIPDASGSVYVSCSEAGDELSVLKWNGSTMELQAVIETALGGSDKTERFMLATSLTGSGGEKPRIVRWYHSSPP
jgi:hypothetical protein